MDYAVINYTDVIRRENVLIGGCVGSGKSTLLHGIMQELICNWENCICIDLKRVEFNRYRGLKNIEVIDTPEEAASALLSVRKYVDKRLARMLKRGETLSSEPTLYIIIDELAELIDTAPECRATLKSILRLARAAKIKVIAATQCPSRKVLDANIQLNFTAQIALRCRSAIESRQVCGFKGAEQLPQYGFCLYMTADKATPEVMRVPMADIEHTITLRKAAGG